jgi:hypothetical protein
VKFRGGISKRLVVQGGLVKFPQRLKVAKQLHWANGGGGF